MAERSKHLELSVSLPTWYDEGETPTSWDEMRELAQQAEAIGVDGIFVADHTGFEGSHGPRTEFWDGWALLPALTTVTSRVVIGPFVAVPSVRHPVALARMAAALDEVSGGRLILGLGSGGLIERAWKTLGVATDQLYGRFEEAIQILAPLLRVGEVDFQGEHFAAHEAKLGPAGPRGGKIPLWIGVKGPRMARLAARWADAVNFGLPLSSLEGAHSLLNGFEEACRDVGREPSSIQKTGLALLSFADPAKDVLGRSFGAIFGNEEEVAAQLHAISRAGIEHISLYINPGTEATSPRTLPTLNAAALERLAGVKAELRRLEFEG